MNRLAVRPLEPAHTPKLRDLLADSFLSAPYSRVMDGAEIVKQIFQAELPVVRSVRWQRQLLLGAWSYDRLLGFADLAVDATLDGQGFQLPQNQVECTLGVLRYLHLPAHPQAAQDVATVLFQEAERIWRKAGVQRVVAFPFGAGYPAFQMGAGLLPGSWDRHFRALTEAGYRLLDRYYCMHRPLQQFLVEVSPLADLALTRQVKGAEQHYQVFHGIDQVAYARILPAQVSVPADANPVIYLADLEVSRAWRGQSIGRWLLRRILNDNSLLQSREIALHVNHAAHAAISLFSQHGFTELNYRGYVFEKQI